MTDEPLYTDAFHNTLDALELWNRHNPTEDRDPGDLIHAEDFTRFLHGWPEDPKPKVDPDDFGAGILEHERPVKP